MIFSKLTCTQVDICVFGFKDISYFNFSHHLPDCTVNSSKAGCCVFLFPMNMFKPMRSFLALQAQRQGRQSSSVINDSIRDLETIFFKKTIWPHHTACGTLVPRPGVKPMPPALEGIVLNTGPLGKSKNHLVFCPDIVSVWLSCSWL